MSVPAALGLLCSCLSGLGSTCLHSFLRNKVRCDSVRFPSHTTYFLPSPALQSLFFLRRFLFAPNSPRPYFPASYCAYCRNLSLFLPPYTFCRTTFSLCPSDELSLHDQKNSNLTNLECSNPDARKLCQVIMENIAPDSRLEGALSQAGVMLTAEIVDDILQRFRYEEKLAFRFFMWAGHQEAYGHRPQTYNNMMDILSSTRYKAEQFGIVCDVLDYMKRKNRSLIPLEVLRTILSTYTEKHLKELKKFTKKKRISVKTQPEIHAFNLLLDSLCKCSLVEEADAMFNRTKKKVIPDVNTYNILFFGWCRVRNPKKAMKILQEMIETGHTPENFTYNAAMDSFCKAGMVSEALELFEFMKTNGSTMSSPTAKTYCLLMVALANCGRMDECFKLLSDMRNSGCVPDVSTYKELIEGMCLAGKLDEAYKLLEEMSNNGYPPDIVTYNCFLKVLCDLREANEAMRLCQRMVEVGCEPSVHTYNMLITMFFKMGVPEGAFDAWDEMDKRGCHRDVDTYCMMIEGLFQSSRVDDACLLLEDVVNKGLKLPYRKFDSFLMRLSEIGNLRAIHMLSDHMRKFYNTAMARRFALSQKRQSLSLRRK